MPGKVRPSNLRELRDSGWVSKTVKQEIRDNFLRMLKEGDELFPGIVGYEDTVVPGIENAILAGHDMVFLGERGQAKSRIIRALTSLLDEWTPVLAGCEIPENPFEPITPLGRQIIDQQGDDALKLVLVT